MDNDAYVPTAGGEPVTWGELQTVLRASLNAEYADLVIGLLERSLPREVPDDAYEDDDGNVIVPTPVADLRCDFCSARPVAAVYPAADIIVWQEPGMAAESIGDWATCADCGRLIEADDRAGLVTRSVDAIAGSGLPAAMRALMLEEIGRIQQRFWEHRAGPPRPV